MTRLLKILMAALLACLPLHAGTVTGPFKSPNGTPIKNGTLGFTLAQAGLAIGSGSVVPVTSSCYTSTDGSIVGVANPLLAPTISSSTSGGLPAGNYYVQLTAYTSDGHETLASPEVIISLPTGGSFTLTYQDPIISGYVLGVKAYVGTASGAETLQGSSSGTLAYTQTAALVSGAAEPTSNSTICSIAFNDTIIPYSGYKVSLISSTGDAYPGFPQLWQLNGGANGTVNVSQGTPLWNGTVIYPQAIVAQPLNHGPQSISGPLGMSGYNIFGVGWLGIGTNNPAYPLDVHGLANTTLGWLLNGNGGTIGQCAGSDGTAFDTPVTCLTSAFYQTVQSHGVPVTQRPVLNLVAPMLAVDNPGAGRTDVTFTPSGNGGVVVTQGTPLPATSTNLARYDGLGNLIPSSVSASSVTATESFSVAGCTPAASTDSDCQGTITLATPMVDLNYTAQLTINATGFSTTPNDGPFLSIEVAGALTTTTIPYNITCTFGCNISTVNTIYVLARHN